MSNTPPGILPRAVVQGIGAGLFLMALFTMMWAGIADGGLEGRDHHIVLLIFAAACLTFIAYGIKLFIAAKKFPKVTTEEDKIEGRNMGKKFGLIFGIEGTAIPITCVILVLVKQEQYILSAIALIVGLHFYPMAGIFKRKIDYYIATWTCLVSITSIFLLHTARQPQTCTMAFLGIGVALATTTYGVYMIVAGSSLLTQRNSFRE